MKVCSEKMNAWLILTESSGRLSVDILFDTEFGIHWVLSIKILMIWYLNYSIN